MHLQELRKGVVYRNQYIIQKIEGHTGEFEGFLGHWLKLMSCHEIILFYNYSALKASCSKAMPLTGPCLAPLRPYPDG